ncbi:hypothetical protein [Pimelobacter simplex]|uniref:hypothetical protein n=1 Tax=Nocardioides simplex TaxID=2045 RepID=UPI0021504E91|nr:hypothetical protein [Pimelobacter simplex]UUW87393.1 hypothetical protein M0M43_16760 [Pimelobacter simplex]UUW96898.1 hypothetical protein M0M48_05405 [Pimelobacter simplex]
MLDRTNDIIGLVLGVIAVLGALLGYLRWVRPRIRRGIGVWVQIRDSLIGREEQRDSITGRKTADALPGIGVRMDNVERGQQEQSRALNHIATLIESQQQQDQRLDTVERRVDALEQAAIERVAGKAESVAAFRAIEAVARQTDPTAPEIEEHPS